jgi:ribosomal protein L20A (L18A)
MAAWTVEGAFYARRGYWQRFRKQCRVESDAAAREWALSEIGSCHHVKRHQIRIEKVTPEPSA